MAQKRYIALLQIVALPAVSGILAYLLANDPSMRQYGDAWPIGAGYGLLIFAALAAGCFWARKPRDHRVTLGFGFPLVLLCGGHFLYTKIMTPSIFAAENRGVLIGVSTVLILVSILYVGYLAKGVFSK